MKRKLLIASLLTATLGATGFAIAEGRQDRGDCDRGSKHSSMKGHGAMMGHKRNPKEMMERKFSSDEIRTLTQAHLIMEGNPNIKVGAITKIDSGYKIAIVTQDNSLVEEREVALNGMPLDMFERMQQRIEKRSKKEDK